MRTQLEDVFVDIWRLGLQVDDLRVSFELLEVLVRQVGWVLQLADVSLGKSYAQPDWNIDFGALFEVLTFLSVGYFLANLVPCLAHGDLIRHQV